LETLSPRFLWEEKKIQSKSPTKINGTQSSSIDLGELVIADLLPLFKGDLEAVKRTPIANLWWKLKSKDRRFEDCCKFGPPFKTKGGMLLRHIVRCLREEI